jgi:hypothetical protein
MIVVFRSDSGGLYESGRTKIIKAMLEESNFCKNNDLNYNQIKLDKIIDHKGGLFVYWNIMPTKEEKDYLKTVWGLFGEDYITHFLNNPIEL